MLLDVWNEMDLLHSYVVPEALSVEVIALVAKVFVPLAVMAISAWCGSKHFFTWGLATFLGVALTLFLIYLALTAHTTFQAARIMHSTRGMKPLHTLDLVKCCVLLFSVLPCFLYSLVF